MGTLNSTPSVLYKNGVWEGGGVSRKQLSQLMVQVKFLTTKGKMPIKTFYITLAVTPLEASSGT